LVFPSVSVVMVASMVIQDDNGRDGAEHHAHHPSGNPGQQRPS
jgi:hypothetical protein